MGGRIGEMCELLHNLNASLFRANCKKARHMRSAAQRFRNQTVREAARRGRGLSVERHELQPDVAMDGPVGSTLHQSAQFTQYGIPLDGFVPWQGVGLSPFEGDGDLGNRPFSLAYSAFSVRRVLRQRAPARNGSTRALWSHSGHMLQMPVCRSKPLRCLHHCK